MAEDKPFSGIKVVELATYLAAPACARILADWGAKVIKIEALTGDTWRRFGQSFDVPTERDENPVFDVVNANKKSLALNLKSEEGMTILHKLLAEADVFITNNRLSPLKRMGLDYETLKERYPKLIYGLTTGYGETGPDAAKPGFDTAAYWAAGGFMADLMVDGPGSYPIFTPVGLGDIATGTMMFGGICAALAARERTGKGDKVSISLFGTAVWTMGIMNTMAQDKYGYHYPKKRRECKPTAMPFLCADGEWMMPTIIEYQRHFPLFCQVMGIPEIAEDPRYLTEADMMQADHKGALIDLLEKRFLTQTSDHWDKAFTEADLVHSRLNHFKEVSHSEQAKANHYVDEVTFRNGTTAWLPRPAVRSENLGLPEYRPAHPLGEDSLAILSALGYSSEEISGMVERKIIRT